MSDIEKVYYSVREGAAYLGCCERTIQRRIRDGSLPTYRLGHHHRLLRQDLDALLRRSVPDAPVR